MYGTFGFYGFYGASSADYKSQIATAKAKIKDLRKKVWKEKILTYARKQAELAVKAAVNNLRILESKYRKAKRDEVKAKAKAKKKGGAAAPAAAATTLTPEMIAAISALIAQLTAAGVDADAAEEQAKATILPLNLRRTIPRGFFRGVRRAGPRPATDNAYGPSSMRPPALPPTVPRFFRPAPGEYPGPTRTLDPFIPGRGIDPFVPGRGINPFVPGRGIDPYVGGTGLIPQSGAFTFPPGNLTDEDPDILDELDETYEGIVDTVKEYAAKPWVMGLALIGAIMYGPKLLRKAKSLLKANPRRRRRVKRNRMKHNRRRRSR